MKKLLSIVLSAALFLAVTSCAHEDVTPSIDNTDKQNTGVTAGTVS
jgi:hypothetical protein